MTAKRSSLLVTKANDLISASYRLTLQEQRLLLAAIAQVDPRKPMPPDHRDRGELRADLWRADPVCLHQPQGSGGFPLRARYPDL